MTDMATQEKFAKELATELNKRAKLNPTYWKSCNGEKMEKPVAEVAKEVAKNSGYDFTDKIEHRGGRAFPDIPAGDFGLEVKTSTSGWEVPGSSVNETSRIEGIEHVWLVFANLSGTIPEFKARLYEKCLARVDVTHYPRYYINIELEEGCDVFTSNGITYEEVRAETDPVRLALALSGCTQESTKWYGRGTNFAKMPVYERNNLIAETFLCCPEMFSNSTSKFDNAAQYLYERGYFGSAVRDIYTAGGKATITLEDGTSFKMPKIYARLYEVKDVVKKYLEEYGNGTCHNGLMKIYVRKYYSDENTTDFSEFWKETVLANAAKDKNVDIAMVKLLVDDVI